MLSLEQDLEPHARACAFPSFTPKRVAENLEFSGCCSGEPPPQIPLFASHADPVAKAEILPFRMHPPSPTDILLWIVDSGLLRFSEVELESQGGSAEVL